MKVLVFGGTGATGNRLVLELLNRRHEVHAVVRSGERLKNNLVAIDETVAERFDRLSVTVASAAELSTHEMDGLVAGCDGVASCLGHNLNLKGLFGKPRDLVSGTVQKIYEAIERQNKGYSTKLILMNTTANLNHTIGEQRQFMEKLVIGIFRTILPPQRDNEKAADYLVKHRTGQNTKVRWVIVRPDTLINEPVASDFEVRSSPSRSPIFDPGRTSRINVAVFMANLIEDNGSFGLWEGQMPVVYNATA